MRRPLSGNKLPIINVPDRLWDFLMDKFPSANCHAGSPQYRYTRDCQHFPFFAHEGCSKEDFQLILQLNKQARKINMILGDEALRREYRK